MTQHGDPGVDRRNPGWYPDPSFPSVVRWWDGKGWTKDTAPNDAKATSLRAPRHVLRTVVLTVVILLAVVGLAGAAVVAWAGYMMSQWASNK